MVEILTFIEHESVPIRPSRLCGQKILERKHADALARLERHLPSKAWSWGNETIKFGHYCGVISLGNLTIEILPKIYGVEMDAGSSRHALVRMLSRSRRLKLSKAGSAGISLQKHSLLDVFISNFCDQLHAQLTQGMIREYIERKENLNVLRGRLRIEQQFKQNLVHRERLFCQYDELSEDNSHNQVLKYVLKILSRMVVGNRLRNQVLELFMRFDQVSDIVADTDLLNSLRFDRSIVRYEPIFDQCRWFLEGLYPDVLAGRESCVSLLFNMNQLFEAYVGALFRKEAWSKGLRVREQGPQKYFARRQDIDRNVFLMKPDIAFLNNCNQVVAIADAKWKLLDEEEKKIGISQSDLYQLESYASRYRVKKLLLAYPMQQKMTVPIQLSLKGSGATVKILPVDLSVKSGIVWPWSDVID